MKTMNLVLPESIESFVQERVAQGDYSDANAYIHDLIIADRKREHVDQLLLEALQSGPTVEVTTGFWEERKRKVAGRSKPLAG